MYAAKQLRKEVDLSEQSISKLIGVSKSMVNTYLNHTESFIKNADYYRKNKERPKQQLTKLSLNSRQVKAVLFVKEKGKITNKDYQQLNDCSRNTASNDLADLVQKDILKPSDVKGAGAFYQLK